MKRPYKLHRFGHAVVVTVPKVILDRLRWKPGTEVLIDEVDGRLIVTTVAQRTKELLELRIRESINKLTKTA